MTRARVYLLAKEHLQLLMRGQAKVRNLPADAEIVATGCGVQGLGVRVHSTTFEAVPSGQQLPTVNAVIERFAT